MPILLFVIAIVLASLNMRPVITSVPPLMGAFQDELGMSGLAVSLLTSIPVLCMGVFAPLAVTFGRRFGTERSILGAMALIGVATGIRAFATSAPLLILTAFLSGVGVGIAGPLLSGFIRQRFAKSSLMISVYSASLVLGAAVAAGLSVPLYEWLGGSWQQALASWGLLAAAAVLCWGMVAARPAPVTPSATGYRLPLGDKQAWMLTMMFGLMAGIFYSMTAWLAPIAESMGYTKQQGGVILTVFTLIQLPMSFIISWLAAKFQRLALWLVLCSVSELVGLAVLLAGGSPLLGGLLVGIGAGGLFPLMLLLPFIVTRRPEEVSSWSALNQGGGYFLGAAGPLLIGRALDWTGNYQLALYGLTAAVLVMMTLQIIVGGSLQAKISIRSGD
ncbi:MFS transporter [Paenibacillus sp. 598K]|uniref:MFS transporter n=1 Tax=Paenibacillus sp. 598K TaxID=1117987 RepID=UPI000FF9DA2C|nr:MFS transporter [Paenibacillus sp. 598K]GBF75097.1 MFS transporter [Paenibacillus sp. 598K]